MSSFCVSSLCRAMRNNNDLMADIGSGHVELDPKQMIGGAGPESDIEEEEPHDIRGSDDDEQEDPKDYCKGGYHPISIGSVFNQRYHVIRKLGWGKNLKKKASSLV